MFLEGEDSTSKELWVLGGQVREGSLRCLGLVWLCGEIQNSGPGFSLWGSHWGKALNCSWPVPMEFGSETRNDWQSTVRIDGSCGARHSQDPGFGSKTPVGVVWQSRNVADSTEATTSPGTLDEHWVKAGIGSQQYHEAAKQWSKMSIQGTNPHVRDGDELTSVWTWRVLPRGTDGDRQTYNGLTRPGSNCMSLFLGWQGVWGLRVKTGKSYWDPFVALQTLTWMLTPISVLSSFSIINDIFPVQRLFSTGKWIFPWTSLGLFLAFKTEISGISLKTLGSAACGIMYIMFILTPTNNSDTPIHFLN